MSFRSLPAALAIAVAVLSMRGRPQPVATHGTVFA